MVARNQLDSARILVLDFVPFAQLRNRRFASFGRLRVSSCYELRCKKLPFQSKKELQEKRKSDSVLTIFKCTAKRLKLYNILPKIAKNTKICSNHKKSKTNFSFGLLFFIHYSSICGRAVLGR